MSAGCIRIMKTMCFANPRCYAWRCMALRYATLEPAPLCSLTSGCVIAFTVESLHSSGFAPTTT